MNVHEGHRERLRSRFLRDGLDGFDDHNVLELLLFYAQPRKDTNELAHRLIKTFGSLDGVFEASAEMLKKVEGMGDVSAALIRLVPEISRRCSIARDGACRVLPDSDAAGRYLLPRFLNCEEEVMYLVCLDAKLAILDCREINRGDTVSVGVNIRRIVQIALEKNATYVMLAHNHTSGLALPSPEDVAATLRVRQVLAQVGVTLSDHIVVAAGDFVSMADSGYIPS